MTYAMRYHNDIRPYFEVSDLTEAKHNIRQYSPCSTRFKAVGRFSEYGRAWTVISFSPYTIGPNLVGYLASYED